MNSKLRKKRISFFAFAFTLLFVLGGCIIEEPYDFESAWQGELSSFTVNQGDRLGTIDYYFSGINPEADTYTLYYKEGNVSLEDLLYNGNRKPNIPPGSETIDDLDDDKEYSFVIVAEKGGFQCFSPVRQARTIRPVGIVVTIAESNLDPVVEWKFIDINGATLPSGSASNVTLEYTFTGLAITGGKLTNKIISENKKQSLPSVVSGEYKIIYNGTDLVTVKDIVVSAIVDGLLVKSEPKNGPSGIIERRLYNIACEKAREYGAIEMFSHGKNYTSVGGLGPYTQARGHTIVNYKNRNPVDLYGATFSFGHGGLSGAAQATQMREWYYDGSYLYGRSNGGNTNIAEDTKTTGATSPVIPSTTASRWPDINSILGAHSEKWTAFYNAFRQGPFNYIPYNIHAGYKGLYDYKFTNPQNTSNNLTSGRSDCPVGLLETDKRGALAYNSNRTFEFTLQFDGNVTGNKTNVEWSGNVNTTNMGHSSITFIIDEDMRFIKYHAMDVYQVSELMSPTTYTCATMYFVYHKNNINFNNHATYRPHQTRDSHVNYCDCNGCETVIAPNGNVATGNMVVANSRYPITLGWTENCTTKVSIPRP